MTPSVAMVALASDLVHPEVLGSLVVLYVGPDQILPLTSILGAVVGMILICWRHVQRLASRVRQFFTRR